MPKPNNIDKLIINGLIDNLSQGEREDLADWIKSSPVNEQRYELLQFRWKARELYDNWESIDLDKNWKAIEKKSKRRSFLSIYQNSIFRYAAVFALILTTIWLFDRISSTSFQNNENKVKRYMLPDSSKVWLKPKASIQFNERSFDEKREVLMNGEVFFEVQKSIIPFTVIANESKVEVLGTSFNVKLASQSTQVILIEGSVSFSSQSQKVRLKPGEKIEYDGTKIEKITDDIDMNLIGWKTGIFKFSNEPLHLVLEQLSPYYGIEFKIADEKRNLLVTTSINQISLDLIIEELKFILDINVVKNNRIITIN